MLNNLGSAEAWDGNGGGDGGQGNGLVVLHGGRRPQHHHHSYPEEVEVEEEPRLPQIWISKSASMELDLI